MSSEPDSEERQAEDWSRSMYLVMLESLRESHLAGETFKAAWARVEDTVSIWAEAADPSGVLIDAWADYRDDGHNIWRSAYANSNYGWLEAMVAV
jgi:hypothetical protein